MTERVADLLLTLPPWSRGWVIVAATALLGTAVHLALYQGVRAAIAWTGRLSFVNRVFLKRVRAPSRALFPLIAMRIGVGAGAPGVYFTPASTVLLGYLLDALIILCFSWLLVRFTLVVEDAVNHRAEIDVADNLEARRVRTRVALLRQMVIAVIVVLGVAMVLMLHPQFRVLGTGILASAGVAGIVIGIAAQGPVRNLLAGVQIALTQPFRIDDVVIVEGEWGRIEEITLTYVVVRIWDLRRLVVPIGYFLDNPFQNWTRTTSSILGTAFLHLDYSAPVQAMREKLREIVERSPKWDGQVVGLQVTELRERTMEVRALVSAANAGDAFDLRCEVREAMIAFLQAEHPHALPRVRAEVETSATAGSGGGAA
jgi:small-conductance mechanosensitive channel